MTWILDLDGVIWLAEEPIDGSVEAVKRLRDRGERLVFLTNNSSLRVDDYLKKLEDMGIDAGRDDVITSALAAASMLEEGQTALVVGGMGVVQALEEQGVEVVYEGDADAVVVGWTKEFDYDKLTKAAHAVMSGARLIGTNDDATYPTPHGPVPGGGSLLAAVAVAGGVDDPEVAGKPHEPVARLIRDRIGDIDVLVGDRPSTDGALARQIDARFVLVLSGVTKEDDLPRVEPEPDEVVENLAELVEDAEDDSEANDSQGGES